MLVFTAWANVFAQPIVSAPMPPVRNAADVVSILSDAYTTTTSPFNIYPNWGQSTQLANFQIGADNINKYSLFNYQGTEFSAGLNVSTMAFLHIDIWTTDCTKFDMFLINTAPPFPSLTEQKVSINTTLGGWTSMDIPLTSYNMIALSNVNQFKFESTPFGYPTGSTTVYVDNLYFWKPANTPTLSNFTIPTQVTTNAPFTITAPTSNSTGAFTYMSSNTSVATIAGNTVTITGAGTSIITANQAAAGAFGAGTITTTLTVNAPSISIAAPIPPVRLPASVISLFSNAYTNVPVDTWRTGWSLPANLTLTDLQIAGNDTKLYSNLDFVGVEFTGANLIDATNMQFIHLDVWTPNATTFRVKLVDVGANADFGGGDDRIHEIVVSPLTQSGWNSYDIPLSDFTGLTTRAHLAQLIFSALPTNIANVYVDNIYFYSAAVLPTVPMFAAPTPNIASGNVTSLFSNAYTNVPVNTWRTGWSQPEATLTLTDLQIAGNDTKLYNNLTYVGIEFLGPNLIDATNKEFFHIDVWTPNATAFKVKLVDFGANGDYQGGDDSEFEITVPSVTQYGWNSYNIPFTAFTGLASRAHLAQLILTAVPGVTTKVYIDNVYFYTIPPAPMVAAPTPPVRLPANVISLFSDAYTNLTVVDFFPNWGQSTVVTDTMVAGNPTKKYSTLNYQGIQIGPTPPSAPAPINLLTFDTMHLDIWTNNCTSFKVSLINTSTGTPVEQAFTITPTVAGWNSVNIPLTAYSSFVAAVNLGAISQIKFDGIPSGTSTVYVDNIYFFKAAPLPIKIASFEANKVGNTALLKWSTSYESNNKGFTVERSTDGTSWTSLQFVDGVGNSSIEQSYSFTDVKPNIGLNYYRFKQVDFDGRFEYSAIKSVRFSNGTDLNLLVFPNPTREKVVIDVTNFNEKTAVVSIVNVEGKIVFTKNVLVQNNNFSLPINVSTLAKGNYFIQVINNNRTVVSKSFVIE